MIHAYYGDGKGKTSAAFGLALRASLRGWRVAVVQFLKGSHRYGEIRAARKFGIEVHRFGRRCLHPNRPDCKNCTDCHLDPRNPLPEDFQNAEKALRKAAQLAKTSQLLVLDEILYALAFKLIPEDDVIDLLKQSECETVLTGNPLPDSLRGLCHYISRFRALKHHYQNGVVSIVGIDH